MILTIRYNPSDTKSYITYMCYSWFNYNDVISLKWGKTQMMFSLINTKCHWGIPVVQSNILYVRFILKGIVTSKITLQAKNVLLQSTVMYSNLID